MENQKKMQVLIACEESQRVCSEFRRLGHTAYSCDIVECSGGHPEWHIKGDALKLINGKCKFTTQDGVEHEIAGKWDLIIAHPPCTYLSIAANRWYNVDRYGDKARERLKEREKAMEFFMKFINADCDKIAVENPVGVVATRYRKPDQIIQPWYWGDNINKSTCLWLKGLPLLQPDVTEKPEMEYIYWVDKKTGRQKRQVKWYYDAWKLPDAERRKARSKTFQGIARAMAEQWGNTEKENPDEK